MPFNYKCLPEKHSSCSVHMFSSESDNVFAGIRKGL